MNFVPLPSSPARTIFDPMTESTGSTALNPSALAPTMIASEPSAAPMGPPETGASMISTAKPHTAITSFTSSAGVDGATVEWMTNDTGTMVLRVVRSARTSARTLRT